MKVITLTGLLRGVPSSLGAETSAQPLTGKQKLLNYAIPAGLFALAGFLVASKQTKSLKYRALGAGAGATFGLALTAMMWPKDTVA